MKRWPILLLMLLLAACEPDGPDDDLPGPDPDDVVLLVGNEGNFLWGNASLTRINLTTGTLQQDAFTAVNEIPVGDVLQSMTLHGDRLFLVVNNSGKMEVVHPRTLESLGTVTGLNSPRYMLPVSSGKAYVTDLYANAISIIDPQSLTVTGSIPCPGWTERMVKVGSKVFVTNMQRPYLYVIDSATDQLTDSIAIQKWAGSMAVDADGQVWVLSSGSSDESLDARLYRIDPMTLTVTRNIAIMGSGAKELQCNAAGDSLFFLHQGVRAMPITSDTYPSAALIPNAGRLFYALHVSTSHGIFVSDAIDYVQTGKVYHFNGTGAELTVFDAGRIPGSFVLLGQ